MSKSIHREINRQIRAEARAHERLVNAHYLIFRVEQHSSDSAYPYLSQQQQILSKVVESIEEDFPLSLGEEIVFHQRPDCGHEYVGVRLSASAPTEEQLEYLRTATAFSKDGCVVAYEILEGGTFLARKEKEYYFWSHDTSQEIEFRAIEA